MVPLLPYDTVFVGLYYLDHRLFQIRLVLLFSSVKIPTSQQLSPFFLSAPYAGAQKKNTIPLGTISLKRFDYLTAAWLQW